MRYSFFMVLLAIVFVWRGFLSAPKALEIIPEGRYSVDGVGCMDDDLAGYRPRGEDHYKRNPPIDAPYLALGFLDFDNVKNRTIKIDTTYFELSVESSKCRNESLYKINLNQNHYLVLNRKNSFLNRPIGCMFTKTISGGELNFSAEYFSERGLLFFFGVSEEIKLRMRKLKGIHYLVFSENNSRETNYLNATNYRDNGKVRGEGENEDANLCPVNEVVAWKLQRI